MARKTGIKQEQGMSRWQGGKQMVQRVPDLMSGLRRRGTMVICILAGGLRPKTDA